MWKFIKMLIGIGLLPLCWAVSFSVYQLYQHSIETVASSHLEVWAFPIGFLLWVLLFFLLPRPMRTYVLGHELTHALWALMMGGRIGKMKVGKTGGHIELSKTNFLITLAPYFFPFYTFIVIAIYYLLGFVVDVESYRLWGLAAVGLTWAFHVTFTISMLSEQQPDIQEHGRVFSYAVIYYANVLLIGLWMVMIGSPKITTFGNLLGPEICTAYSFVWHYILVGYEQVLQMVTSGGNEQTAIQ